MNLMSPKGIGKKACLRARGPFGLPNNLGPKIYPNIQKKRRLKKTREFMKTTKGGVHCNRYDCHCTTQWVKIPKAI